MTAVRLDADAQTRFNRILDLFPIADARDKAYVERAKVRGWKSFQRLPAGTGKEKLLDVGSMNGLFGPAYIEVWNYGEVRLLGADVSTGTLKRSGLAGSYELATASCNIELDPWPYPDNAFDTVVCTEVLEHLCFDPVFAMNELNRVLAPGGQALITIPNATSDSCLTFLANNQQPGFLRQYISDALKSGERNVGTIYNLGHFHEYTRPELECLARATGFDILTMEGLSPFPPLLASPRFRLLCAFARALFPNARRIRGDLIVALLRKRQYTPLNQLTDRYPAPLYRALSTAGS